MSRFTGPLTIQEVSPGKKWKLVEPMFYDVFKEHSGFTIKIPEGFETDATSIPYFLRLFLSVWGTYGRASLIHDYLYDLGRSGDFKNTEQVLKPFQYYKYLNYNTSVIGKKANIKLYRKFADKEFKTAALALGTNRILANIMYIAVRLFGSNYIKGS